jgi:hypothetical protein
VGVPDDLDAAVYTGDWRAVERIVIGCDEVVRDEASRWYSERGNAAAASFAECSGTRNARDTVAVAMLLAIGLAPSGGAAARLVPWPRQLFWWRNPPGDAERAVLRVLGDQPRAWCAEFAQVAWSRRSPRPEAR